MSRHPATKSRQTDPIKPKTAEPALPQPATRRHRAEAATRRPCRRPMVAVAQHRRAVAAMPAPRWAATEQRMAGMSVAPREHLRRTPEPAETLAWSSRSRAARVRRIAPPTHRCATQLWIAASCACWRTTAAARMHCPTASGRATTRRSASSAKAKRTATAQLRCAATTVHASRAWSKPIAASFRARPFAAPTANASRASVRTTAPRQCPSATTPANARVAATAQSALTCRTRRSARPQPAPASNASATPNAPSPPRRQKESSPPAVR